MSVAVVLGLTVSLALFLRASLTSARVGTWDLEQANTKTRVWEAGGPLKFISLARAGPGRNDGDPNIHSGWTGEKEEKLLNQEAELKRLWEKARGITPRGSQGTGRSYKDPGVVSLLEPACYQPTIRMNMALAETS